VKHTEDALVVDVFDGVPKTNWEGDYQDVEIKKEGEPCSRLMLRDGGDDWNVNFGVTSVP